MLILFSIDTKAINELAIGMDILESDNITVLNPSVNELTSLDPSGCPYLSGYKICPNTSVNFFIWKRGSFPGGGCRGTRWYAPDVSGDSIQWEIHERSSGTVLYITQWLDIHTNFEFAQNTSIPGYVFANPGEYVVFFREKNVLNVVSEVIDEGAGLSFVGGAYIVTVLGEPDIRDIVVPTSTCLGSEVCISFDASNFPTNFPNEFKVDWGDGSGFENVSIVITGIGPGARYDFANTICHTYTSTGNFPISIYASNFAHNDGSDYCGVFQNSYEIEIKNCNSNPCKPFPIFPVSGCAGASLTFDIGARKCADQCLTSTTWDFGDSYSAVGNIVTHSYTTPGTYTVRVTTTDNCGHQSYIFTQTVVVNDCGCVQSLVATQMSCNEFNFTLNCQACVKEMQINYFDGSPTVTCPLGCSFVHTFPADGTYPVTMVVTLCDGTRLRLSTTVVVDCGNESKCKCEIKADFTVDGEHPMYFSSTSAVGAGTNIVGYVWDFGDGNTVINDPNPTHDYGASGSYNVCLTVLAQHDIDKSKCWDQICLPVEAALKMMDGKVGSEFSTTQSNTKGDITIYPNPAYSSISIDYLLDIASKANLEIVNAEGVVLTTKMLDAQKGSVKLDVSGFADGLYICQIKQEGASAKTAKFSVVKH